MNQTALVPAADPDARGIRVVNSDVAVMDTSKFEHMQRIALIMSKGTLVPKTLVGDCAPEQALANCFLVVNQAVSWGLDPFAVAQCCSVVHGRLMFEGKLVAAVLDAKLGVRLSYTYNGASGDAFGVVVSATLPGEDEPRTVEGTVGAWKTSGNGSPWGNPQNHHRQLAYRGAREWARRHAPAVLLGVYTDDEIDVSDRETAAPRRSLLPASVKDQAPVVEAQALAAKAKAVKAARQPKSEAPKPADGATDPGKAATGVIFPPMSLDAALERIAFPGEALQDILPAVLMNSGHDVTEPQYVLSCWLAVAARLELAETELPGPQESLMGFLIAAARARQSGDNDSFIDLGELLNTPANEWPEIQRKRGRLMYGVLAKATPVQGDA